MSSILRSKLKKIQFPALTNIRNSKKKVKNAKGKIHLKYNHINNFVFNDAFDVKKIKYNKNYNNEQSLSLVFKTHLKDVFKIIKSNFKKDIKILEVGCGKGIFFEILEKRYKFIRGFDSTYEGKNKKIKKRYLDEKDIIDEKLIILRHTLEHIQKPYDFLFFLKKISINNPFILIEAPNFEWKLKRQTFFDITYEQPNYFTMKTFQNIFSNKLIYKKKLFGKQYMLVVARLNDLNNNIKNNIKSRKITLDKLFPNLLKKFNTLKNINQNIFIWGGATKSLMFLIYLKVFNPSIFKKVKFAIDIDKKKQNKFLQIVDIMIISPKKMLKIIKNGDTILISNSNYLFEIKKYVKEHIDLKIDYKCID